MTISWTHAVEDRLQRLESRQERLQSRILALVDHVPAAPAAAGDRGAGDAGRTPGSGRAAAQGSGGVPAGRAGMPVRSRVVDPAMVPAAGPVTYMPQPGGRWVARPTGTAGGGAAGAAAAGAGHAVPQPIGGGQTATRPALGMWVPPRIEGGQLARRDRRVGIKQRLDTLSDSARRLSTAVQRLETMVSLMAQVVTVAVDPNARPQSLAAGSSDGSGAGALSSSLLGLLGSQGGTGEGGGAGSSEGGAVDGSDGSGGGRTVQGLAALLPLLEQLTGSPGQARTSASMGAVLGSPAFQQLLSMVRK